MSMMTLDTTVNSKDIKVLPKNIKDLEEQEDNNFFESIVEELLSEVKDSSSKNFLLGKLLNLSSNLENEKEIISSFSEEELTLKSENNTENVLVEDLLKLAMLLKNSIDDKVAVNFPTNSKELKPLLSKSNFTADIKSATNIKELLQVAQKYDIKVKNFEFFKEELALDTKNAQAIKALKSEDIFKLIENKLESKVSQLSKDIKNTTPKEHTLKELLSNLNKTKNISSSHDKHDNRVILADKVIEKEVKLDNNLTIKNNDKKQLDSKIIVKNQDDKLVLQEIKTIKVEDNIVKTKIVTKTTNQLENVVKKVQQVVTKKTEKVDNKKIENADKKVDIEVKIDKKSELSQKIDSIKSSISHDMKNIEIKKPQTSLSQILKTVENSESNIAQNDIEIESNKPQIQKLDTQVPTLKTSHDKQPVEFKRTFDSFATDFKEKVEAYKPPLMKVKMQLNPVGLGEVDVTIVNRGNNLHINVNSNQNTIALFSQNQAEFKTSLVNMGFSELSMNFNENGKNQRDNQQEKKSKNINENFEEFEQDSENFEIITPRYV